jgi:hypothetical protein
MLCVRKLNGLEKILKNGENSSDQGCARIMISNNANQVFPKYFFGHFM